MFLQASVILSTGGCASVHDGIPPPKSRHPSGRRHPPRSRHTPQEQTPPGKQTPAYGQRAAGTHPTGMHSCYNDNFTDYLFTTHDLNDFDCKCIDFDYFYTSSYLHVFTDHL